MNHNHRPHCDSETGGLSHLCKDITNAGGNSGDGDGGNRDLGRSHGDGEMISEGAEAEEMESEDPFRDFVGSICEMMVCYGLRLNQEVETLFLHFLRLNHWKEVSNDDPMEGAGEVGEKEERERRERERDLQFVLEGYFGK